MQARHNNSKKGAKTTIVPIWTILIQSQGDIQNADPADVRFWDKVAEICTAVLATDRRNLKALYRRCVNPGVCACDWRRMYVDR